MISSELLEEAQLKRRVIVDSALLKSPSKSYDSEYLPRLSDHIAQKGIREI